MPRRLHHRRLIHLAGTMALSTALACGCAQDPAPQSDKNKNRKGGSDDRDDDATGTGGGTGGGTGTGTSTGAYTGTGSGGQGPAAGSVAKEKRRITFQGSRGDNIPGYLWLPAREPGRKFPAVLIMYGIKGSKDDGSINAAGDVLADSGFVAMTMDWPGTGERQPAIGNQARITDSSVAVWTANDYVMAYNHLQAQPEVDPGRMGYVGASMGAMTGMIFAAADQRVKAMAAIVPIPNPLWGSHDPSASIRRISPRPVLCVGTSDNSDFSALVCNNVGPGGEKRSLPGGHELEGFQAQVVNEIKTFLSSKL